ncbi:MAG TPA: 2'-deoxycytidine 5'-triphosphate deaminase, partial [Terriglobia bacterium]|nr:2'-deoxycytidine 5'-triphosphate deaminase [Terriglobia bacterium]
MKNPPQAGVLNRAGLERCFREEWVAPLPKKPLGEDASALDLEIGGPYWELSASIRPKEDQEIREAIKPVVRGKERTLGKDKLRLKTGKIYLFKTRQQLRLPTIATGRSTGRSSVGRLDVLTRLLCDRNATFDEVPAGYSGPLYVEVIANSFPIIVSEGMVLNQLRLFWGRPEEARLTLREAMWLADEGTVIWREDRPFHGEELEARELKLTVKLPGLKELAAYEARELWHSRAIDVERHNGYAVKDYWNLIKNQEGGITLKKEHFYILASNERFCLPSTVCVECRAYQETLGEYRIHYAGFAHPWFGAMRPDKRGAPLILEVRPHSADVRLSGHEPVAQVEFYRMQEPAPRPRTPPAYSGQELTLPPCFRPLSDSQAAAAASPS